jgi:topoisomerase-4 subunit A
MSEMIDEMTEDNPTPDMFSGGGGDDLPPGGGDDVEGGDVPSLAQYAERAYLEYAMSVVKGRALPDVADGQKPVQRRILYAMNEMGLTSTSKHVKSARVVGEILGKYHPHGDTSAYEAMVRLAQDFTMRYPLIDGQGNFGSRDGDGAAAMRYTEARLTPLAELLLSEIDMGTVDFVPNYDGAFQEPKVLPARLPMVLLNGAAGIAVGMATEMPPHNLREVAKAAIALIRKPNLSVEDLLAHIPGPDFPGGGQIISSTQDILNAYQNGRGSLRVRARWEVEELARREWRIVVKELPYGVSAQKILTEIEEATNPKVKAGKKSLTQEQSNLRQMMLSVLDKVRDESGQQDPVRLVFEPKSSRQNPEEFMNMLLAHTSLEVGVAANMVMVGLDGRPQQKNIRQILSEWIEFRFSTVTRRSQFRLGQVEKRIHILEGRMIAFLSIDKVIKVIRNSDEPKVDLMAKFKLTEVQAEDILEIRLRQLARLEGIKIENELKALQEERDGLNHLLSSDAALRDLIIAEIKADAKQYGDDRRTLIQPTERASATQVVADEPVTIVLSKNGWIRSRSGHGIEPASLSFKDGDSLLELCETRTVHPVILLDSNGRAYTVQAGDIQGGRGDGVPVASLIELQDGGKVSQMLSGEPESKYLVANSGGYGFIAAIRDMVSRVRAGKAFMALEKGEQMLRPVLIEHLDNPHVAVASTLGRLIVFPLPEMKELAKGRGVILMKFDKGDEIAVVGLVQTGGFAVEGLGRGGKNDSCNVSASDIGEYLGPRARKGKLLARKLKPTGFRRPAPPQQ